VPRKAILGGESLKTSLPLMRTPLLLMRRFPARICSKVDFPAMYRRGSLNACGLLGKCGEAHTSVCADYDRSGSRWKLEGNIGKRGCVTCTRMIVGKAMYCDSHTSVRHDLGLFKRHSKPTGGRAHGSMTRGNVLTDAVPYSRG
jgi:hypothetical protein